MNVKVGDRVKLATNISKAGGTYPYLAPRVGQIATIVSYEAASDLFYLAWDDGSREYLSWYSWTFESGNFFEPFEETNEWEGHLELL